MFKLIPTNTKFYDYFDQLTDIVVRTAARFSEFAKTFQNPTAHADEIKNLEHTADEVTHVTMELLHRSFITPIERGDISRLVETIDDIADFLDDAARRIVLYEVYQPIPEVIELATILAEATKVVRSAVHQLRSLHKKNDILSHCIEIRRLENEGDRVNHEALGRLFKSNGDPLTVLKWKEIIIDIESAIDRCQDVANVVEGIMLENT